MSNFLNNSVDYSEEYQIKRALKAIILDKKNPSKVSFSNGNSSILFNGTFIVNNYKKYLLFITSASSSKKTVLFFCPYEETKDYFSNNLLQRGTLSEFFIQTKLDLLKKFGNFVIEGYMYSSEKNKEFHMTDIHNSMSLSEKRTVMKDLTECLGDSLNGVVRIKLHGYVPEHLIQLYLCNFKHKNELIAVTDQCGQQLFLKKERGSDNEGETQQKKIVKIIGKSGLYKVFDVASGEYQGLLYIKTLQDSIDIEKLFSETGDNDVLLDCTFNTHFLKWEKASLK